MILATVTDWTAVAIVGTFAALFLLGRWDYRRTFRQIDNRFELEASSKDFNYHRELRVKDRTRRGPEAEAHWGKADRGRAA
jgi:hypothetical protein